MLFPYLKNDLFRQKRNFRIMLRSLNAYIDFCATQAFLTDFSICLAFNAHVKQQWQQYAR